MSAGRSWKRSTAGPTGQAHLDLIDSAGICRVRKCQFWDRSPTGNWPPADTAAQPAADPPGARTVKRGPEPQSRFEAEPYQAGTSTKWACVPGPGQGPPVLATKECKRNHPDRRWRVRFGHRCRRSRPRPGPGRPTRATRPRLGPACLRGVNESVRPGHAMSNWGGHRVGDEPGPAVV